MSDLSDCDYDYFTNDINDTGNFYDEVNDEEENHNIMIEKLFQLSNRLQLYCKDRGLPIFNESQTTAILIHMFYQ